MTGAFTTVDSGVVLQLNRVPGVIWDVIDFFVGGIVDVFPAVIQAVLALLVGVVVAFLLADRAFSLAIDADLDGRVAQTPFGALFAADEPDVASAVASFVKYLVLVVTILVAIALLNVRAVSQVNQAMLLYAPRVLAGLLVGILGFLVGRVGFRLVSTALAGRGFGNALSGTALDTAVDAGSIDFPTIAGRVVEYYVYIVTLFVVADVIQVEPLEQLFASAAFYAPELIAAGVVFLLGLVVAQFVGEIVSRSDSASSVPASGILTEASKAVVVLVAAVVALDVAGVSTGLLITVLAVVILPVALGIAIAVGLAFGHGGSDHVSDHIEEWG